MRALLKLTLLAALAALAVPACAQTIYVVTADYHSHSPAFSLGTLTLQTGAFHAIATNKRYENVKALGFGANGELYALCRDSSSGRGEMDEYSVDTTTGEMTLQQKFAHTLIVCAGADSKGVFTGFLIDNDANAIKLFTLDPVAQSLQVGALTLVQPAGLVAVDGLGNVYASGNQPGDFGAEKIFKVNNTRTGAAVVLGNTGLPPTFSGFLFHGLLYALGEDKHSLRTRGSRRGSIHLPGTGIYTLNPTTGAASLVVRSTIPSGSYVQAATLAPIPAVNTNKEPTFISNHFRRNLPPRVN